MFNYASKDANSYFQCVLCASHLAKYHIYILHIVLRPNREQLYKLYIINIMTVLSIKQLRAVQFRSEGSSAWWLSAAFEEEALTKEDLEVSASLLPLFHGCHTFSLNTPSHYQIISNSADPSGLFLFFTGHFSSLLGLHS